MELTPLPFIAMPADVRFVRYVAPKDHRLRCAWLVAAVLLVLAAGCSSTADGDGPNTDEEASAESTPEPTTIEEGELPPPVVVMARGDWETGWFQAEIVAQLVGELGYDVSSPADNELAPATAYPAMARGEVDFWANGWFPHHDEFLDVELPGGGLVSDAVEPVGELAPSAGLLGFLVSRWFADDVNLTYVDDIGQNGDLAAQFDVDGNGVGDIIGCDEEWACHRDIDEMIAANGWRLEQFSGDYDQVISSARSRITSGLPTLLFTWAPSAYVADLVPGADVAWMGVRDPLDGRSGPADLTAPACLADPCETGFRAADLAVVANSDFLAAHPDVSSLLDQIEVSPADIAAQNKLFANGESTADDLSEQARAWIEANRELVDIWLENADF